MFAGIVTSLCFHNDHILLAGHGPYLKVYNIQTGKILCSDYVMQANRIHRIVPCRSDIDMLNYKDNINQVTCRSKSNFVRLENRDQKIGHIWIKILIHPYDRGIR